MDDLPSQLLFSHLEIPESFDDLLNSGGGGGGATTTCTHTHTCDPPGPSAAAHTHTCLHAHTQVFAGGEDEEDPAAARSSPRRPLGNREAVRRYREKKKAHAAFLEEEVRSLRAANEQLLRRLRGHAALEAEAARLRGLLLDVRGRIDAEVAGAASPFQKQSSFGSTACSDHPALCFAGNPEVGGVGACEESSRAAAAAAAVDCMVQEHGSVSREIDIPEAAHSLDVVASFDFCLSN